MSRSTAEGQTTSRHSRVVDGLVIVAIMLGVVVNAVIVIDHRNDPATLDPAPASNSVIADPTEPSSVAPSDGPPATVAGLVEERPAWAKELSDQVNVLAALIARQQVPAPTPTVRRTNLTVPPATVKVAPVELGPATAIERADPVPEGESTPNTTVPSIADETTTTTTMGPDPTYHSTG